MSNQLYPKWKETMLSEKLSAPNIKAILVNTITATIYTYSAAHQYLDDVASGAILSTSGNLASKTFTNGIFDADDLTPAFASVGAGDALEAVILYEDTGSGATSELIIYIDSATGLAITPDGNNINMTFNATGIFGI